MKPTESVWRWAPYKPVFIYGYFYCPIALVSILTSFWFVHRWDVERRISAHLDYRKAVPGHVCPVAKCGGMTRSGWKALFLAMRERALRTQPSATISYRIDSEQ